MRNRKNGRRNDYGNIRRGEKGIGIQTDKNHDARHGEQKEYMPWYILMIIENSEYNAKLQKASRGCSKWGWHQAFHWWLKLQDDNETKY